MKRTPPRHSILGEVTDDTTHDLAQMVSGASHESYVGDYSSAQMAVLKDIASLQVKAIRKFGESGSRAWWVTRHGLQQSTQNTVAELKASWFGDEPVLDVCCGLGSDLIALSRRGPTVGIDLDEDVLSFASANLRVARTDAVLQIADVVKTPSDRLLGEARLVHVDPDRRINGNRHTHCDDLVPDWERLGVILNGCRGGVVKLAPATHLDVEQAGAFHRMWITAGGSVREQTLIAGDVLDHAWIRERGLRPGTRSAVCLRDATTHWFAGSERTSDVSPTSRKSFGGYLIDPDAAIRAAGLTEAFAERIDAQPIDRYSGFLTVDELAPLRSHWPMMSIGRILEVVGCDDRKLRRCFRARNAYPAVIKVRSADQDPAVLSKRLRACGEQPLGLWIGRNGKRIFAAITQDVSEDEMAHRPDLK